MKSNNQKSNHTYYVSTSRWGEQGVFLSSDPMFSDGVPASFIGFDSEEDAWSFWGFCVGD